MDGGARRAPIVATRRGRALCALPRALSRCREPRAGRGASAGGIKVGAAICTYDGRALSFPSTDVDGNALPYHMDRESHSLICSGIDREHVSGYEIF